MGVNVTGKHQVVVVGGQGVGKVALTRGDLRR